MLEIPDMVAHLRALLAQVPPGRVTTYRALADALGNPIAVRWVADYIAHHVHDAGCACHRVVRADGQLSVGAADDRAERVGRLRAEGVLVGPEGVDLTRYSFDQFVGDAPLERLKRVQREVETQVSLRGPRRLPPAIGGVDVSYPHEDEGVGAYTLVETVSGRLVWSTTVRRRVVFPYISSYLSFRELPVLLALLDEARKVGRLAGLVLVDGTGILHPRHAGIASHLGVLANLPTVGITKRLLVGRVDLAGLKALESRPVVHEDQTIGVAIRPSSRSRRPIFVSAGHRMNLETAEAAVRRMLLGRRLPEPLYWADRLSRDAGRC